MRGQSSRPVSYKRHSLVESNVSSRLHPTKSKSSRISPVKTQERRLRSRRGSSSKESKSSQRLGLVGVQVRPVAVRQLMLAQAANAGGPAKKSAPAAEQEQVSPARSMTEISEFDDQQAPAILAAVSSNSKEFNSHNKGGDNESLQT